MQDDKQRALNQRRAAKLRDRLLDQLGNEGPKTDRETDALVRLALLLAAEVPPDEADAILDALTPYVAQIQTDHAAALSEALVMRGRIDEAAAIWEDLKPIERMQAQLRCLGHRLLAAAKTYKQSPVLDAVVEVMIEAPVNTLADITETAHDRETTLAAYSGVRLLHRTLEQAVVLAPELIPCLARLTSLGKADASIKEAAERIFADAEGFSITPAEVPHHLSRDPMVKRIDEMMRSRLAPGKGAPANPKKYVETLRRACYGETAA